MIKMLNVQTEKQWKYENDENAEHEEDAENGDIDTHDENDAHKN